MGLLDGLEPATRTYTCRVAVLYAELEPSDAKILRAAIDDEKTWTTNGLKMRLASRGITISQDAINKHRTKVCACSRT